MGSGLVSSNDRSVGQFEELCWGIMKCESDSECVVKLAEMLDQALSSQLPHDAKLKILLGCHAQVCAAIGRLQPSLPRKAPEKYARRLDRTETPVTFIKRAYAHWLGTGLSTADIHRLDPQLSNCLRVWCSTYGKPDDFDLPSRAQKVAELIAALDLNGEAKRGNIIVRRIQDANRVKVRKGRHVPR
jgi:hypothetical protein